MKMRWLSVSVGCGCAVYWRMMPRDKAVFELPPAPGGLSGQHKLGDGRAARGGGANPGSQTEEVVGKPGRYQSAGIGEG
jgi:hypothetical protein